MSINLSREAAISLDGLTISGEEYKKLVKFKEDILNTTSIRQLFTLINRYQEEEEKEKNNDNL